MYAVQLSLFDTPSVKPQELCKNWKGGYKNENGVYVGNAIEIVTECNRRKLSLSIVLSYPYVLAELDIYSDPDSCYGHCSPLTDNSSMRFSVFTDEDKAIEYLTVGCTDKIIQDLNLSKASKDAFLRLLPILIARAIKSITE